MAKKVFIFFLIISILGLGFLGGWYHYDKMKNTVNEPVVVVPNLSADEENGESDEDEAENAEDSEEAEYSSDVYSVHLCDGYSDGTFAIRNIKLGMTFRQVVNTELKNIGVYVSNKDYGKDTFYAMASEDGEGKDLLPVTKRALLGNACEIVYNFSADITIEEPSEYPYLESVQFQFVENKDGVDSERKIEAAFQDCFGKPDTEISGGYYVSTFTGTKEEVKMFYEYIEKTETYNLKYILWETLEE